MIGRTLSHYRIEAKLGEGGMGVVYRAFDTHLERLVAIKVLPSEALADPEKRKRFVHEAKAASALNHPNIITVYDIDNVEGVDLISMEFVAGRTLLQLIPDKGLELSAVMKYAVQIADALAAAHAVGIVHRDIKPANVMVTGPTTNHPGLVKVLDFGLAKLEEPVGGAAHEGDLSGQITAAMNAGPRTEPGVVVGTANYMSPEQAAGRMVDARSDIFAFGALLYEMITGRRAFRGENKIATLSAILHVEPEPAGKVVTSLPHDLDRIVSRCLRKDPEYRFQHMADVKVALREIKEEAESGVAFAPAHAGVPAEPIRRRNVARLAALALSLLAAAGLLAWWRMRIPSPVSAPTLSRMTSDSGLTTDPAISPDGKLLAFASDRGGDGNLDIWMRQVAGGEPIRLTSNSADDSQPAFSPDGVSIAFRSEREGGGVYVVPALGGEERLLARYGRNPRYSRDGKWIALWIGERQASAKIAVVPASGGASRELEFHPPLTQTRYPLWSPDGKHLLFLGRAGAEFGDTNYDWWVASVDTGAATPTGAFRVFERQTLPHSYSTAPGDWVSDQILFSAGGGDQQAKRPAQGHDVAVLYDTANLWRVSIDPKNWRIAASATRLTFGTGLTIKPSVGAGFLVFASLAENLNVWSLPMDTNQGKLRGELRRLTQAAAPEAYPSISENGNLLVFASDLAGSSDLRLKDLESGREVRLTTDPAFKTFPMLSADGSRIAYEVIENQKRSIYILPLGPGGRPGVAQRVGEDCGYLSDLSADGEKILYYEEPPKGITVMDVTTGRKTALLQHRNYLADPRFSADGRWVAFHVITDPVRRRVYVAPVRPNAPTPEQDWIPVTDGSAIERFASWSPDGSVLYFVSERDAFRCIAARRLDPATKRPVGPMFWVQHFHSARSSMMEFPNANLARVAVARDKLVFSLGERTGNIWVTSTTNP